MKFSSRHFEAALVLFKWFLITEFFLYHNFIDMGRKDGRKEEGRRKKKINKEEGKNDEKVKRGEIRFSVCPSCAN